MYAIAFKYLCFEFIVSVLFFKCASTKEKPAHIQIPGTVVSITPAPDFILAPEIGGFKHKSLTSSIMVLEITKTYENIVAEITKEKMAKQVTTLISYDSVSIQDYSGILYKTSRLTQGLIFMQWVLVLPIKEHAITINGTFLKQDEKELSENIKKAILSTHISPSTIDQNILSFNIDADSLKIAKILQGPSIMFTRNGAWNDASIFDLSFFAGPSNKYEAVPQTDEFAKWQLKEVCADCEIVKNGINQVTIDSLKGYEVVALSKDTISGAVKRLKYEVILFDSGQYYLLVGTSTKNSEDRINMFKKISRTFRRKNNS